MSVDLTDLVRAGILTEEEAEQLLTRKTVRDFADQAVRTIQGLSPWDVVSVEIVTEQWKIAFSDGKVTVVRVKPRSRTIKSQSQGQGQGNVEGIPVEIWKAAAAALGVKFFGAKAAARSGRVREKAIQLAREKGIIA